MKYIYKEDILGFLALPCEKQEEIEQLARKGVAKPKAVLIETFAWIIIGAIPVLGNKWKPILGEEDALWASLIVIIPLALLRVFIHNTMLINPRIKGIMEKQPNQST